MEPVGEPEGAHGEDRYAGRDPRDDRRAELKATERPCANYGPSCRSRQRIRKEVPTGRTEKLSGPAHSMGAEDRQTQSAFHQVRKQGTEAEGWAKHEADEDNPQGLQRDRHRREVKRDRDMRADGDKRGG